MENAADANHLTAEQVWKFENSRRKALPFISLASNISTITAIGNDKSFQEIFSRQVEALGQKNDILISIYLVRVVILLMQLKKLTP